ncbi:unnamed protein product [Didymodactylos carnosus]|uniref:Uncharacterized protein n=1 Tax=Didymodactylos carnosus TaxID=1234261 RepID=A0A815RW03_9BILA|nr:unnamed protein product [Didymodactylos carnosus]CAF4347327.1 unnamed protein product [Didymodactylos carnosus]
MQDEGNRSAYYSYILFVDLLKQMSQTKQEKEITLKKCKDYYRRNKSELEKIEVFRHTYTSVTAVNWYTRNSFAHMPIKDFDNITANIDGLISTNGFLSTSNDHTSASQFVLSASDTEGFKVVLFEITVEPSNLQNIAFADIEHFAGSYEREVLFNIDSVFKTENVAYDTEFNV